MAALSPALSNNSNDTATTTATAAASTAASFIAAAAGATTATSLQRSDPPKTQRGLNKPKCIKCGNVARSRCPYQSCKSCCAKAQNPCHIHVLKANATFTDKVPPSGSPLFDQQSNEVSSSGTSLRVSSLRQLSNNFAQFNSVQIPLRSRKPLTKKDAVAINEWRFSKLKEYKDRNIEVENEAFDRYMQNVSLLEEIFSMTSVLEKELTEDADPTNSNPNSLEDKSGTLGIKLRLKSNPVRSDNFRKRVKEIVDQGLRKLQKIKPSNSDNDSNVHGEQKIMPSKSKASRYDRFFALTDLIDKLNKARNVEDLKSCSEIKSQLFNGDKKTIEETKAEVAEVSHEQTDSNELEDRQQLSYSLPKLYNISEIDQETLYNIDAHFASPEQIEGL